MTQDPLSSAYGDTPDHRAAHTTPVRALRAWLSRILRGGTPAKLPAEGADVHTDPLLAFDTERGAALAGPPKYAPPARGTVTPFRGRSLAITAAAIALMLVVAGLLWFGRGWLPGTADPVPGKLTVDTRPAGAQIIIDGVVRGTTPLTLSLPAGVHNVTLRRGTDERSVPVRLSAGAEVTHYFELTSAAPAAAKGQISVVTEPPGARVQIDGRSHGTAPVTVSDLAAANYRVAVSSPAGTAERTVAVANGATTSVVFSLGNAATAAAGWVLFTAPFEVQIGEDDVVLATARSARISLKTGTHRLSLVNEALQFEETRQVVVTAGQTTTVKVDPPRVPVSANARPWADVIIDGTNVGQTPIANLPVTIGQHEVIFRHPEFGEQRRTMVVTMRGTNRIAVDLTRP